MNTKRKQEELKDFTRTADGDLVYTGTMHYYAAENSRPFNIYIRDLLALCGVSAFSAVMAGCIRVPGMLNHWYVIIPYAIMLISSLLTLWGSARIAMHGTELRDYVYKRTVEVLQPRAGACMIFAAVTLVAYLIHLATHGAGDFSRILIAVFPVYPVICGCLSFAVLKLTKTIIWH